MSHEAASIRRERFGVVRESTHEVEPTALAPLDHPSYYLKSLLVCVRRKLRLFSRSGSMRLEGFLTVARNGATRPMNAIVTMRFWIHDLWGSVLAAGGPCEVHVTDGEFTIDLPFRHAIPQGFLECEVDGHAVPPRVQV